MAPTEITPGIAAGKATPSKLSLPAEAMMTKLGLASSTSKIASTSSGVGNSPPRLRLMASTPRAAA